MKQIYLDNAASTPIDPKVLTTICEQEKNNFGNSASLHSFGDTANQVLEKSRKIIANFLNADTNEIIFTASATESNNLVLKGVCEESQDKGKTIIISAIEHDSIINQATQLKEKGFKIKFAPVDKFGVVKLKELKKLINNDTILVSIIHANNEIGTIQPIKKIANICQQKNILFHTDASQSFGKLPIDIKNLGVDLLTASSHKIYGPKGAALLYVKTGIKIKPQLLGGGQEFNLRASTVNIPAIAGFAEAVKIAKQKMKKENLETRQLTNNFIKKITKIIPGLQLTGHPKKRLPNIISFLFSGIEGESILMSLNELGVAVSTGSACSSKNLEPSHVLQACGFSQDKIHGSIRISLGRFTKKEEIDYLIKILPPIIEKLRKISPYGNKK